jgi:hypothetical protein
MADAYLNPCNDPSPLEPSLNIDPVNPNCPDCEKHPSQKDVPLFQDIRKDKMGIGQEANCDPMQFGHIVDDFKEDPDRLHAPWMASYIPRYSKAKRGADEAVMDLFRDLVVIDEQGTAHPVPIIWATQERAVAAIVQENVRKDDSTVIDRIRLPMLAIYDSDFSINQERYIYHQAVDYLRGADGKPGITRREKYERDTIFGVTRGIPVDIGYTLFAWTLYKEDMNQIVEQIVLKFSPIAYIKVQGVYWETIVKLESIANNENVEPGGSNLRVIKWQFNLKAETFIPQPIIRKKAVLKTRVDVVDGLNEAEITEIIARLEDSAGELK